MNARLLTVLATLLMLAGASASFAQTTIPWGNLQWPFEVTDPTCSATTFYGQVWMPGLTDLTTGPDGGMQVQLGFGPEPGNPGIWYWLEAVPNAGFVHGSNDEYMLTLNWQLPLGLYQYTFRYRLLSETGWYTAAERGHATVTQICGPVPSEGMSWGQIKALY